MEARYPERVIHLQGGKQRGSMVDSPEQPASKEKSRHEHVLDMSAKNLLRAEPQEPV